MCVPHVPGTHKRSEKGVRCPRTEVTDDCQPPCGCWEPKVGPLHERMSHSPILAESILNFTENSFFVNENSFFVVKIMIYGIYKF